MNDNGIVAIYNDDLIELKKEFESEFNSITEDYNDGFFTFYFSRYDNYAIITEAVLCMLFDNTAMFFTTPYTMNVRLNETLEVIDGNIIHAGDLFTDMLMTNDSPITYIGEVCTSKGMVYGVYTFSKQKALEEANHILTNELFPLEMLTIDDDDMIEVSMDYLYHRIEKFKEQVDRTIELEEDVYNLTENPYANAYYDRDETKQTQPLSQAYRLGVGHE